MKKESLKFKIIYFKKLNSTNLKLKTLIKKNKNINNLCVCSNYQTKGYGRRNTKWHSYSGNIHLSILIKPNCQLMKVNQLSFLTCLSLGEILKNLVKKKKISYKWPNDILLNKKKISGIIIETSSNIRSKVTWAIIGIGINISKYPKNNNIQFPATSLSDERIFVEKDFILKLFIKNFFKNYLYWKKNGFAKIKRKWLFNLYKEKNKIIVKSNNQIYKGIFVNLSNDGNLKLLINKKIKIFSFGNQLV